MITLVLENWPMICLAIAGGFFLGIGSKYLFNAIGALSEFKEISQRVKRDAEIIKRESETVMPLARKMTESAQSLGEDLWKLKTYHDMQSEIDALKREFRRLSSDIERAK